MRDASGRLVGRSLSLGAPYCLYHAVLFTTYPAELCDAVVAYIDLETNSLDVLSGNIIEICALVGDGRAVFSTVVNPGRRGSTEAVAIHGISPEELEQRPSRSIINLSSPENALLRFENDGVCGSRRGGLCPHFGNRAIRVPKTRSSLRKT